MTTACDEKPTQTSAIQIINFGIGTCALGLVLVATTSKGVCSILLGSKEDSLMGQLRSIFPQATLVKGNKELDAALNTINQLIEAPTASFDLILDICGTAFQKEVWKALREIPTGQTATYKEIGLKVSGTAQEVGEACAANTLAIVIPCHRVIRSDGGLAGFRWGVHRKRLLLQREQEISPDPKSLFAMPALIKGKTPF